MLDRNWLNTVVPELFCEKMNMKGSFPGLSILRDHSFDLSRFYRNVWLDLLQVFLSMMFLEGVSLGCLRVYAGMIASLDSHFNGFFVGICNWPWMSICAGCCQLGHSSEELCVRR